MIKGKNVVLGVCGGIACYKAADLTRKLVKEGYIVTVVMTKAATQFVTPLTFQTLSCNPVALDMFNLVEESMIGHIAIADRADALLIAPATANIIGKAASGIADDMLSTIITATKAPIVFAPAMNSNMYANPVVQGNIEKLKKIGCYFIPPAKGELACGYEGEGRLPEVEFIIEELNVILTENDLKGKSIVVTAGPTEEPLDPVRFITNRSSGKMGYAIAQMARKRGGDVTLISGPVHLDPPYGVKLVSVRTASEMFKEVKKVFKNCDILIKAAAVADYKPSKVYGEKIKKEVLTPSFEFERNVDILVEIGKIRKNQVIVGFAAETTDLIKNARKKLEEKKLDYIVANDITAEGAGFKTDTNIVKILHKNGRIEELPKMLKSEIANIILNRAAGIK